MGPKPESNHSLARGPQAPEHRQITHQGDLVPGPVASIGVYDTDGKPLSGATVRLEPDRETGGRPRQLTFDARSGRYLSGGLAPGAYQLAVSAGGLAGERREVRVDPAGLEAVAVLGKPGLPHIFRGPVRVPFEPRHELVAVALSAEGLDRAPEATDVAGRFGLRRVPTSEAIEREGVLILEAKTAIDDSRLVEIEDGLLASGLVRAVGRIVRIAEDSVAFLTNELIVKLRSHVDLDQIPRVAEQYGLERLRRLPQAGNAFLFRVPGPASYRVLDTATALVESGLAEYAEPNLIVTAVDDDINPGDFLASMQWHLQLVRLPQAWQVLHDNLGAAQAFGSPAINIAVVDSGVQVTNPDFAGNVSSGAAKVYQAFDFRTMVANNNSRPGGGHGTACAGIATALAGNAAPVGAADFGVVGAAGNCRLMAIERPGAGTEVQYSDLYIWVGGFNPASSQLGFPGQISPGADVITSSFGVSVGLPISGLMKDTFDLLTTYGRSGRGVPLFFSAGNASMDFTLQRPWAAYTRTFAVAASTLDTDGITENRAWYSNYGGTGAGAAVIDFCAPSSSNGPYDPPRSYGTLTVSDTTSLDYPADAPSYPTAQTTLAAAAAVGATSLTVAGTAGFAVGQLLLIGAGGTPGAEFGSVTAVPDLTHLSVAALKNAHAAGSQIAAGPGSSLTHFGGTSSATPLCAGIAALLLSLRPALTWIEVRDALRGTAARIDPTNTDPIGIWTDAAGVAYGQPGYAAPLYSRWYGYGRVDAAAAAAAVLTPSGADVVVRDNLADVGAEPVAGAFWDSPDIWVRNQSPAAEGAAALPPDYATAGPSLPAVAAQDNYVYVRVRNVGPAPTSTFYVRVYIAHWPGTEFIYPTDFMPSNRPGQPLPAPLTPGTYLIGEVQHGPLAAGASDIVNVRWAQTAIPPQTVVIGGTTVTWHPCLLVEVSPQDGPTASGNHVWDSNNLGQKNISISYAAADGSFAAAVMLGAAEAESGALRIAIERPRLPEPARLYLEVLDPKVARALARRIHDPVPGPAPKLEMITLAETPALVAAGHGPAGGTLMTLPARSRVTVERGLDADGPLGEILAVGHHQGREVFWLRSRDRVEFDLPGSTGSYLPLVVGGILPAGAREPARISITQRRAADGRITGGAAIEVHPAKQPG